MTKLSKMPKQVGETIWIDLGDKVSRYCIVDHQGDVVEEGSFRNQALYRNAFRRPAAANCAGSGRAIGLDQPRVEVDHLERLQERSRRCA